MFGYILQFAIYENQEAYYKALVISDAQNESTVFIEFMLDMILQTLRDYARTSENIEFENNLVAYNLDKHDKEFFDVIKQYLLENETISSTTAALLVAKSVPTVRRYLNRLVDCGLLEKQGNNKNRSYCLKKSK